MTERKPFLQLINDLVGMIRVKGKERHTDQSTTLFPYKIGLSLIHQYYTTQKITCKGGE